MNNAGMGWQIVSAADFNDDGSPDILWQDQNYLMYLWYLSGHLQVDASNVNGAGTGWTAAGTGDFNADTRPDIVWRNGNEIKISFMNNAAWLSADTVNATVDAVWRIAAIADYNNDLKPDLLFQNESTGQLYAWFMNGSQKIGESNVNNAGAGWVVVSPR